jgi:uncharacterized protein YecE (DUF72 family)
MPDESDFSTSAQPSLQQLVDYFVDSFFDVKRIQRLENAMRNAHAEGATIATGRCRSVRARHGRHAREVAFEQVYEMSLSGQWAIAGVVHRRRSSESKAPRRTCSRHATIRRTRQIGAASPKWHLRNSRAGGRAGARRRERETVHGHARAHGDHCWAEGIIVEEGRRLRHRASHIEEISKLATELISGWGLNRLARVAMRPLAQTALPRRSIGR